MNFPSFIPSKQKRKCEPFERFRKRWKIFCHLYYSSVDLKIDEMASLKASKASWRGRLQAKRQVNHQQPVFLH